MNDLLLIILLTLVPALELRASIPFGILRTDFHWSIVFLVATITNILLGPIMYYFLDFFIKWFTKIKAIDRCYKWYEGKVKKKIQSKVEKYGEIGLALFIGVPLPGSGVYSGALAAYLLGLSKRKFFYATVMGILIAGVAVTIISLAVARGSDAGFLDFLIKR